MESPEVKLRSLNSLKIEDKKNLVLYYKMVGQLTQ